MKNKLIIRLTESELHSVISEATRMILTEADTNVNKLKRYLDRLFPNVDDETKKGYIKTLKEYFEVGGNKYVKMLPNLGRIAFSELGFMQANYDEQKTATLKQIVDLVIKVDKEAFVEFCNKQPTYESLTSKYLPYIEDMKRNMRDSVNGGKYNRNSNYEIIRIKSIDEAYKYGKYSGDNGRGALCFTNNKRSWNSFSNGGRYACYVCLRNGWKTTPCEKTEGYPKDSYGTSMIFLFVDGCGDLAYSNSRWNHGDNSYGNVDHMFTSQEISKIVGVNFYDVFKPNPKPNPWKELTDNCLDRINNGEDPKEVFEMVGESSEGFTVVAIKGKFNYIYKSDNGYKYVSPNQWFKRENSFSEGLAMVQYDYGSCGFIDKNGNEAFGGKRFKYAESFSEGLAVVQYEDWSIGYIDRNGNEACGGKRFKQAYSFSEGFASVQYEDESYGFIDRNGNEACGGKRFMEVYSFSEGLGRVAYEDNSMGYIDRNGNEACGGKRFMEAYSFSEGLAMVQYDYGSCGFIDKNGNEAFGGKRFVDADSFSDGLAVVEFKEGPWAYMDKQGRLYDRDTKQPIGRSIYESRSNRIHNILMESINEILL